MSDITIALAGNPNCGKTTLFNALTGARQRVGNWPGVTVERIEGNYRHNDRDVLVVDLPGIYSFSAYSLDEKISREYILEQKPDVVVNIVDATNLERNLYLTTQLIEMKVPVVVALNMMDLAAQRQVEIEIDHLEKHLGCPVVPLVAPKRIGVPELKAAIADIAMRHAVPVTKVAYDSEVEEAIEHIQPDVAAAAGAGGVDPRWLAIKLLEQDALAQQIAGGAARDTVAAEQRRIARHTGDATDIVMADGRYGFIHGLARDVVRRREAARRRISDTIDRVVLNRVLGIPIFLAVMYGVFMLTIQVGKPFIAFFDQLCGTLLVDGVRVLLQNVGAPGFVIAFLADGVGGGIQTVATFIPPVFFIFFCLSILEDSGYMARAGFVMDRLLRVIGLPGKAFLPMLIGFGCNVPAILATRTLDNQRDRTLTILMNPFMSCGARLPVYTLFAVAFFPHSGGLVVFSLYVIGIALAILTGLLLTRTVLKGDVSSFVMELPTYHVPTLRGILHHTWARMRGFIVRAGKVILIAVVVLRMLSSVSVSGQWVQDRPQDSVLSGVGRAIVPVFAPMGVRADNWPAAVGLFAGVFGKEAVIGTLEALYSQADSAAAAGGQDDFDLAAGLRDAFGALPRGFADLARSMSHPLGQADQGSAARLDAAARAGVSVETFDAMHRFFGNPAAAYAYLLFILIYFPCVAVIAVIYREIGMGWAAFSLSYLTALAWLVSTAFYQLATITVRPGSSLLWLAGCAGILMCFIAGLQIKARLAGRTNG